MSARWIALVVWAAVAAAAVFWGFRIFVQPAGTPAHATVARAVLPAAELSRVLGTPMAPAADDEETGPAPADDGRFVLVGVVAPKNSAAGTREGVALISVDGEPPRAFRVGAAVDGERILQKVSLRGAEIGPRRGPAEVSLELPPPAPPATGVPVPAGVGQPGMPGGMRQGMPPPAPMPGRPFVQPGMPAVQLPAIQMPPPAPEGDDTIDAEGDTGNTE